MDPCLLGLLTESAAGLHGFAQVRSDSMMHTMHGTQGCTISVDYCVMDLQQISLRDNALLRRHAECNFPPRSTYSLSSHMSAAWHMRNLDSIGPDGNLLPEPLTCQELCVVKLFGRIRTAKKTVNGSVA